MFEVPFAHESNEQAYRYFHPELEVEFEDEWAAHEHSLYSNPYTNTYANNEYANSEMEADPFLPFLPLLAIGGKLALKKLALAGAKKLALKGAKKLALKGAKKLISRAPKILNKLNRLQRLDTSRSDTNRSSQSANRPSQPASRQPPVSRSPMPRPRSPGFSRLQIARGLVERLKNVLNEGESQATALEAEFFGANEFEGELANHQPAHEIALTEVLAAEASHTESEAEAEALMGAALPITLRIMGGSPMLQQATPSLLRANVNLVRHLHRLGREGRPFLRIVSAIHRRTIASLRAVQLRGGVITPDLVSHIMRAHTIRILRKPQVLGPTLVRNFAIRRATVGVTR
jgi:hypothetical protein